MFNFNLSVTEIHFFALLDIIFGKNAKDIKYISALFSASF